MPELSKAANWSKIPDHLCAHAVETYHVVPGAVMSSDLTEAMTAATVQGGDVTFTLDGGGKVNDANIITADIAASNGVIHVIDNVIMPHAN